MRVLVAGATGVVGQPLVEQLVAAGHDVVATTRSPAKLAVLQRLGAEPALMDGLDTASVAETVTSARPDVIVHQMTQLTGATDLRHFDRAFTVTNQLRTAGTEHLLTAARAAGVRRLVAQSYTGWPYARAGGAIKTEHDPLDPHPPASQRATLAAIRRLEEMLVAAEDVEGVVLRYGPLYGRGASDAMFDLVRRRRLPLIGKGGGIWSWLHVADAASAAVAALNHGAPGVYNIVDDDPAPTAVWLPFLAEVLGVRRPLRIPEWMGRLAAGEAVVSMMTEARGASNAKAKLELGWEPRWASWRHGFPTVARDCATHAPIAGVPDADRQRVTP